MKTILITLTALLLTVNMLFAQRASFTSNGTIEYEKSSNMHALYKRMYAGEEGFYKTMIEQSERTQAQFKVLKSTLTFGDNKTLYKPIVPATPTGGLSVPMAEQYNTVFTDYSTHGIITEKLVLNESFTIKDTIRKIVWKITNETRDIAGYPCRRANGIMLDSIYVVAFYTDKITVPGGPESFGGLPGMILQLALPHENVSWIAKTVDVNQVPPPTLVPAKKAKVITYKELSNTLKTVMKSWYDDDRQRNFAMLSYIL